MNRQGDILIQKCSEIPQDAQPVAAVAGRYMLALGEATGHHHSVLAEPGVELYERDGVLYMRCDHATETVHQEHGPQVIPAGISTVTRQRTWTSGSVKRVVD